MWRPNLHPPMVPPLAIPVRRIQPHSRGARRSWHVWTTALRQMSASPGPADHRELTRHWRRNDAPLGEPGRSAALAHLSHSVDCKVEHEWSPCVVDADVKPRA